MQIVKTKHLTENRFNQINKLWNEEYPLKLKDRFGLLLDGAEKFNHYIIEDEFGTVMCWAVEFEKDNETRFSIIVNQAHQGKGLGKMVINRMKKDVAEFYGWVIDHNNDYKADNMKYISPLDFYAKLGFEVLNDKRIDNDILNAVKIRWKQLK